MFDFAYFCRFIVENRTTRTHGQTFPRCSSYWFPCIYICTEPKSIQTSVLFARIHGSYLYWSLFKLDSFVISLNIIFTASNFTPFQTRKLLTFTTQKRPASLLRKQCWSQSEAYLHFRVRLNRARPCFENRKTYLSRIFNYLKSICLHFYDKLNQKNQSDPVPFLVAFNTCSSCCKFQSCHGILSLSSVALLVSSLHRPLLDRRITIVLECCCYDTQHHSGAAACSGAAPGPKW